MKIGYISAMNFLKEDMVKSTAEYVQASLAGAEGGHDWWHIYRVWQNAKEIARHEQVDIFVVELAALLHDIADAKFHDGDEEAGPVKARTFLEEMKLGKDTIDHVVNIIRNISFRKSFDALSFNSPELQVVQDADRLDAMGAIGIARAFSYGGHKGRMFYDPEIKPNLNLTKEQYKTSDAPTINHFYEKLLLLRDLMNTATGKVMAEQRHRFMEQYLEQFYQEWEGRI